jgi:hypothetical protein
MGVYRNLGNAQNKKVWDAVDAAEKIISEWPEWKRGVEANEVSDIIPADVAPTKEPTNKQRKRSR